MNKWPDYWPFRLSHGMWTERKGFWRVTVLPVPGRRIAKGKWVSYDDIVWC